MSPTPGDLAGHRGVRQRRAVAVAVSVHGLACHPVFTRGDDEQKQRRLPGLLSGNLIGAFSLSEPQAGSDAAALTCRASQASGGYRITGTKSWITHGGIADVYNVCVRTGSGPKGVSRFLIDRDTAGLVFGAPEEKMGLHAVPTTSATYDNARVDADRLIGAEGDGPPIAFSALDSGRLGIAAVATGLAQAALDAAVELTTFGRKIIDHQGLGFLLADMAAAAGDQPGVDVKSALISGHPRTARRCHAARCARRVSRRVGRRVADAGS